MVTRVSNTDPAYFTPGNPKRQRIMTVDWYKKAWLKAFTQEEVIEKIKNLPDLDFIKEFNRIFVPREVKMDTNSTFQLIINGLPTKVIDTKAIDNKALDEHDPDE